MKLTHFDHDGKAIMIDVADKKATKRTAVAVGAVYMKKTTLDLITDKKLSKGDVLGIARVAGIMAAKKAPELIPLCHPLNLSSVTVEFDTNKKTSAVLIKTTVKLTGQTGVEMEALTAASVAALTIYDMCKAVDKEMVIGDIKLIEKRGGKSGTFRRKDK
jgi:cyclic pyranopterin monophosphate synthase